MRYDINGYPQLNTEDKNIKSNKINNSIEIKTPTKIIYADGGYTPEIATKNRLGVVKIGNDLDIDDNGVLSAAVHIENLLQNDTVFLNCGTSTTVI